MPQLPPTPRATGRYQVPQPPRPGITHRGPWVPLVLIGVALLLLASATIVGRAWLKVSAGRPPHIAATAAPTTRPALTDAAATDASTACQIIVRLPTLTDHPDQLRQTYLHRISAADDLASAAAHTSSRYQPLAEATTAALRAAQIADAPAADQRIRDARTACEAL